MELEWVEEEEEEEGRVLGPWNSAVQHCYERCVEEARRDCYHDPYRLFEDCVEEESEKCAEACLEEYGG